MKEVQLHEVKAGDKVKITLITTGTVDHVDHVNQRIAWKPGAVVSAHKIELSAPPKPKAGEVIDGRRVKDTMWKRGTILRHEFKPLAFVLHADGLWHSLNTTFRFSFGEIRDSEQYEVVFVA